ncbi:MAG: OadG family protein [Paludibacteraceae bacterium]|nr:OadG family protein [Paludibacteraceae bacterium]
MQFNYDNFIDSLTLMGVGIATVFAVLLLIIFLGNLLISFVNKYVPEEAPKQNAPAAPASSAVDPNVAMAINLAISKLTGGKSKAEKIEKI